MSSTPAPATTPGGSDHAVGVPRTTPAECCTHSVQAATPLGWLRHVLDVASAAWDVYWLP